MSAFPDPRRVGSRLAARFLRLLRRDEGTATIEFVIALPVLFVLFCSAAEAGFVQLRYIMMEHGLDLTVRELRLGEIDSPTHDKIKAEICRLSVVIPDCVNSIMVELQPVDTSTWDGLDDNATCVDRSEPVGAQQPPNLDPGVEDQLMLIRACAVFDPIFPTIGLGLQMNKDSSGAYHLIASSAFVNEPS